MKNIALIFMCTESSSRVMINNVPFLSVQNHGCALLSVHSLYSYTLSTHVKLHLTLSYNIQYITCPCIGEFDIRIFL